MKPLEQQTVKILIVDDCQDAAGTTADLLALQGRCDVRVAYDGLQAVEAARHFLPHIVIVDINMPVMNGYEAARMLRAEELAGERLLLIALTGRTRPDDIKNAAEAGFDHHLSKPLDVRELCELVDARIRRLAACQQPRPTPGGAAVAAGAAASPGIAATLQTARATARGAAG